LSRAFPRRWNDSRHGVAQGFGAALERLVILQARNRIPPRNAAVLAYTFQLLLQSLPETKSEVGDAWRFPNSDPHITQAVNALPPLDPAPGIAKSRSKKS